MGVFDEIRKRIREVPQGRVSTYGEIGRLAGTGPRTVSRCLAAKKKGEAPLPWQRILGKGGRILIPDEGGALQRTLLEKEGVVFEADGSVDLARFGWPEQPPMEAELPEDIADLLC